MATHLHPNDRKLLSMDPHAARAREASSRPTPWSGGARAPTSHDPIAGHVNSHPAAAHPAFHAAMAHAPAPAAASGSGGAGLGPTPGKLPQQVGKGGQWTGAVREPHGEAATYDYFEHAIQASGGKFDTRPEHRNILGIRGWENGHPVPSIKDHYDDTLAVMWDDKQGHKHVHEYLASVKPGTFPQYYNPLGDAVLMNGQYDYTLGDHKGHPALVQNGPVQIWRDANKDGIRERNEISQKGWFGIDIHAGGAEDHVGNWSAGCQVIKGGWDGGPWQDFIKQMQADPSHRYKYSLMDGAHMPHNQEPGKSQGHA